MSASRSPTLTMVVSGQAATLAVVAVKLVSHFELSFSSMGRLWRLAFLPYSSGSRAQHWDASTPRGVPPVETARVACRINPTIPVGLLPMGPRFSVAGWVL